MAKYLLTKKGMFSSNYAEVGGFIKSSESEEYPDI